MRGEARLLICKYCGEAFDSMPRLAAHISNHHSSRRARRDAEIISLLTQILEETRRINRGLEELKAAVEKLKITEFTRVESVRKVEVEAASRPPETGKLLPSFLQGNPWVEILSRRGRS